MTGSRLRRTVRPREERWRCGAPRPGSPLGPFLLASVAGGPAGPCARGGSGRQRLHLHVSGGYLVRAAEQALALPGHRRRAESKIGVADEEAVDLVGDSL